MIEIKYMSTSEVIIESLYSCKSLWYSWKLLKALSANRKATKEKKQHNLQGLKPL